MKRCFGKKLIEDYIRTWDLTHVLDTSGACIPGHGTPTTILFGRNIKPVKSTVRTVMGIKGEPATPDDPAKAKFGALLLIKLIVQDRNVNSSARRILRGRNFTSTLGASAAEVRQA